MINLIKRNLLLFFRDKASVFFSLLSVFIIIGLYVFFLGDLSASSLEESGILGANYITSSWIMAGVVAVASMTTTLGALSIIINDRVNKVTKDFFAAPIKKSHIISGYLISSVIIGLILTTISFILGQAYILSNGGSMLSLISVLECLGIIVLSTIASSSIVFFIVIFIKSESAFATVSTIFGTLIGFVTGVYVPIGQLSGAFQIVIKCFPISHTALLLRQVMMNNALAQGFAGAPAESLQAFKETMGVVFKFGSYEVSPLVSIAILLGTSILFFGLSILVLRKKKKEVF